MPWPEALREGGPALPGVGGVGLGALHLSSTRRPAEADAIAVLHRALALGVTLIDTADSYGRDDSEQHENERLIHRALQSYPGDTSGVTVATKGGMVRPGGAWVVNAEPEHLRRAIRGSFEALGGQKPIDLWQLHAVDPRHPLEACLAVAREAVDQGWVRHIGLSNVSLPLLQRARRVVPVVSVQNELNPWQRASVFNNVIACCEDEGLAFLAWSPLGGPGRVKELEALPGLRELAGARGVSVHRFALAWVRTVSPCVVPIPGVSRLSTLEDALGAATLDLTPEELRRMESLLPHRRRVL
ncbi:aldo/keto reductase [Corallococcus sp. AS-1-12]|uniref:aldo/keto reductase n=1 Tax=Corallococcus sp. AS-1-12 TaxID=2874598 RepID=UPI001CBAD4FB|nr:aldo/keto reductase [Corallococcus sp. AS-1-12]MBZ4329963.1 aldo/keto reductase [Corallococcus sp. AS-1-12]